MYKKINIWGRNFNLKVIFDVYKGETILNIQNEALDKFVKESESIFKDFSAVERYCIDKDHDCIGDSIDNIFRYVIPKCLYIGRDEKKRTVSLLCNYRYDEEHGIALNYVNEKLVQIGTQDIV